MTQESSGHVWGNADAYEAFMGRWSRPAADAVLAWLQPDVGLRWLDVGCGTGALTGAILERADPQAVFGIDPSADLLAGAGRIIDSRVTFEVGSAEKLPVAANAFDVVIAGLVLHFVPDPIAAIAEMKRAAAPGAIVVAYVWDPEGEHQFTRYLWRAALPLDPGAAAADPSRQGFMGRDELASVFAS